MVTTSFIRVFLTAFVLTLNSTDAWAQRFEDVIYLKNGSIVRGMIISDTTGSGNTLILSNSGDTWAFDKAEIDSVGREKKFEYKAVLFNTKGSEFKVDAEFLLRSGNNAIGRAVIPGIGIGYGLRINKHFCTSVETGMQFYEYMEIPVSLSMRARVTERAIAPLLFIRTGYTIPGEKREDDFDYSYSSRGGVNFATGAGIERIINGNAALLLTFSWHYQELNYHLSSLHQWVQDRDRKEAYSRFRITLGYVFR